jgi:hypothetical protein
LKSRLLQQAQTLGAPIAAVARAITIPRQQTFAKKDALAVFDISQPSANKRFYLIDLGQAVNSESGTTMTRRVLRSLLSDVIAGRDVLEYCHSGLGDTHEATEVHYVFRRDGRRLYTVVVACRAGANPTAS